MEDRRVWEPIAPHYDFDDSKINRVIEENSDFIFGEHNIGDVTSRFNFPITQRVGNEHWLSELIPILESVASLHEEEAYKLNSFP